MEVEGARSWGTMWWPRKPQPPTTRMEVVRLEVGGLGEVIFGFAGVGMRWLSELFVEGSSKVVPADLFAVRLKHDWLERVELDACQPCGNITTFAKLILQSKKMLPFLLLIIRVIVLFYTSKELS